MEASGYGAEGLGLRTLGGGVLAGARSSKGFHAYRKAGPEILARIEALDGACRPHEVPLAAAALQFSMRDPRIVSTVAGASRPERVDRMVELARWPIPPELWDDLRPLAAPRDHLVQLTREITA